MASVYKNSEGKWCGAVICGMKPNGKPNRKYVYGKTKKEVEEKVRKIRTDIFDFGQAIEECKITLSEWGYKHLFTNMRTAIAKTTFDVYVGYYDVHIKKSTLGHMDIKNIRQIHLQEYFNDKDDLAHETLKKIYNILSSMFESAISNNLIRVNPIKGVRLKRDEEDKSIRCFTMEEQKKYIDQAEKDLYGLMFIVDLFTGLRIGELTALKWCNVNLDDQVINVVESISRIKVYDKHGDYTKETITKAPKTKSSKREITIPKFIVTLLKKHKLASKYIEDNDFVFSTSTRTNITHPNARRSHYRICDRAGIQRIPVHGLRHTFATRLIEQGENPKTVQALLGHSDIKTTMNIYVSVMDDTKKSAAITQERLYEQLSAINGVL